MQRINTDLVAALRGRVEVDLIALGLGQRHLSWFLPYALIRGACSPCDIIHLGDGLMAPLGWLISAIRRRPYTLTLCGLEITYRNRLYRSVVLPFIRKAERIVCISESTRNLALANGCDADRCVVIPCGVQVEIGKQPDRAAVRARIVERYGIPPGDLILLSVGRLVRRKGVSWFIREVLPALNRTTLLVAGGGPEREIIERAAGERRNVRLLGRVDDEALRLLYGGSDVFVMPNLPVAGDSEGFGVVLLEAGLGGLYPLAADIDGIPEAVCDGANGKLLESGNPAAWIREIAWCEENRETVRRLGEQAREYVTRHSSWDGIADRYRGLWAETARVKARGQNSA